MTGEIEKRRLKTGFKEVMKLLTESRAQKIYVAENCDSKMKEALIEAAKAAGAETEYAEDMRTLGKMCGIDVGASCAAIIK